eukprot:489324_1
MSVIDTGQKVLEYGVTVSLYSLFTPLFRCQQVLQTQHEYIRSQRIPKSEHFRGIFNILRRTTKTHGFKYIFRGNVFAMTGYFLTLPLGEILSNQLDSYSLVSYTFSPLAVASAVCNTICHPFNYLFTKYSCDVSLTHQSLKDVMTETQNLYGIKGFYRGVGLTILHSITSCCIGLGIFYAVFYANEHEKSLQKMSNNEFDIDEYDDENLALKVQKTMELANSGLYETYFASAFCACYCLGEFMAYPINTVKRSLMLTHCWKDYNGYENAYCCMQTILKENGWKGLYKGYSVQFMLSAAWMIPFFVGTSWIKQKWVEIEQKSAD